MWISKKERRAYRRIVDAFRRSRKPLDGWDVLRAAGSLLTYSVVGYLYPLEKAGVIAPVEGGCWKLLVKTRKPFLRVQRACGGSGLFVND